MSISRVVLPVVDLEQNDNPLRKTVLKGAKHYTVQQIVPDSQSTNSIVFTVNPPSQNTVIDRRLDLAVPWQVTTTAAGFNPGLIAADDAAEFARANCLFPDVWGFNSSNLAASTDLANNDFLANSIPCHLINNLALRQFPMSSVMNSIDLVINGTHISTEVKKYVHAVAKYTSSSYREWALGSVAHHPDNHYGSYFRQYTNNLSSTTAGAIRNAYTGQVNPLAMNANLGKDGETPRGYYWTMNTFQNSNEVAFDPVKGGVAEGVATANGVKTLGQTIKFTCIEPLMISPLSLHYGEGMTNVNEIQVTVNWDTGKLNRILSGFSMGANAASADQIKRVLNGTDGTSQVINVDGENVLSLAYAGNSTNNSRLLVRYYTAQDDIRIPNEIVLPYYQPRVFTQSIDNLATPSNPNRTSVTYNGNVRRLDQIPSSVYLFARNKDSNLNVSTPDAFLQLRSLNITFGNQTGILSNHNAYQLFKIAVENGADYESFYQDFQNQGLVLKLEFGKDIPLANNESPGTRGDYSIQISATVNTGFVGLDADAADVAVLQNLDFREVYVNNGQVIISPNECRVQTGLLDIKDNIEAEDMGDHYDNRHANNLMGAGLFSTLGKFIGKAASGIAKHAPTIAKGLSTASDVATAAGNVAQSMSNQGGSATGGSIVGGSVTGGSATGGSMTGGRRLRSRRF